MPFFTLQIAKGYSLDKKRKIAKALTAPIVSTLATKPEWLTIHIDGF